MLSLYCTCSDCYNKWYSQPQCDSVPEDYSYNTINKSAYCTSFVATSHSIIVKAGVRRSFQVNKRDCSGTASRVTPQGSHQLVNASGGNPVLLQCNILALYTRSYRTNRSTSTQADSDSNLTVTQSVTWRSQLQVWLQVASASAYPIMIIVEPEAGSRLGPWPWPKKGRQTASDSDETAAAACSMDERHCWAAWYSNSWPGHSHTVPGWDDAIRRTLQASLAGRASS